MTEVFENQEFGSIRVLQEAGTTFFCASDAAKALGYNHPIPSILSQRHIQRHHDAKADGKENRPNVGVLSL